MTGGLLQLAATGSQNVYLNKNPEVLFFKQSYRRHVNFAIETIKVQFREQVNFGKKVTVIIPRNGDLVGQIFLHLVLPSLAVPAGSTFAGWVNSIGQVIMDEIELEIGGVCIDKQFGVWMHIWDELTLSDSILNGKNIATGSFDDVSALTSNATSETEYWVPLPFWWNRHQGLALPLLALQYHEIKINIKLRPFSECVTYDGAIEPDSVDITKAELEAHYYYLEDLVRSDFAQNSHQYLYEELQFREQESIPATTLEYVHKAEIEFNHAVKELVWVLVEQDSLDNNDWLNFSRRADNTKLLNEARILVDGQERIRAFGEGYFRLGQTMEHHTRVPNKFIYVYSFALKPEMMQPTGTMNFSRFDFVNLELKIREGNPQSVLFIYAINYNIGVVKGGMFQRLYST